MGVNLFVVRPDEIPSGLGLLEIDNKVIESVKMNERNRMKEYLANLDTHNLRFVPLSVTCSPRWPSSVPAPSDPMRRILKIGHRGAAGHAPENTLAAIRKGIALGVDFVEIDVRCTADGVLVVLHDSTVNRTTNGKGPIDRLSLRDVKALDAGNGECIPTLEEVLNVVAGQTGLMVELKIKGVAQKTVEAVQNCRIQRACHLCFLPARGAGNYSID